MSGHAQSARALNAIACFEAVELAGHAQRLHPEAFLAMKAFGEGVAEIGMMRIERMKGGAHGRTGSDAGR